MSFFCLRSLVISVLLWVYTSRRLIVLWFQVMFINTFFEVNSQREFRLIIYGTVAALDYYSNETNKISISKYAVLNH